MKTYLIDPNKKWCKANLHCHTTHSDGYFTPEEIKKYYMEQGYSIVAYTDHEVIFDVSHLTDENFVAITAVEYSINDYEKPANETYVDYEGKPIWRDLRVMHLNLFSKDPHNVVHPGASEENFSDYNRQKYAPNIIQYDGYHRVFTPESIQETIDRANKAGFLVQFNHPNWSLNTREDYINLKGLWGLEILNYLTEIETGAEYCINIYDDMVREGHKICCTMGDDNHNYEGGFEGSFGGFNYIGVDELTYDEVLTAMENGNIYASSGPIIKSLYIDSDDEKIYVECSEATDIIFVGYNRTFRHYHGEDLTKADFKIFGGEVYFRITVKDKYGHVAHTHAYYLNK
ncbi:MAG: hypothetical protein MJ248_05520 [Bacilli bacterium]|nr:hypothetical protein [Bacilli bacterium]